MVLPLRFLLVLVTCAIGIGHAAEDRNLGVEPSGKRVALVIGNAAYPGAPLRNPVNDARDMAAALRKLGFEVIEKFDSTQKDMNRAIAQFGQKLRADTVALFYYAGHGMQVKGKNYLLPIDAQIASEASARAETVDVETVMDQLAVSTMNIVILDACRNNPFERRFRSGGGGLAQMDAPRGSLIAYATAPGKVANDGDGKNGLYTQELLKHIQTPGLPLEAVFKRVRNGVVQGSGEAQTPWEASSLTGDFYFLAGGGGQANSPAPLARPAAAAPSSFAPVAAVAPTATAPLAAMDPESQFWNEVKSSGAREYFDAYLKQYPKGKYLALAKVELKKLDEKDKAQRAREEAERKASAEREWQEALRAEQDAWDRSKAAGTAVAYADYLGRFPKGRYALLAQAGQQKALREEAEKEKRDAAQRKQDEERQKLVAERERREAEERKRLEAERLAEQQRKAREEAARGPQWAEADNGDVLNWNEATDFCARKGSGWRLPTSEELQSIAGAGYSNPCGVWKCKLEPRFRLSGPWFWTSTRDGAARAFLLAADQSTIVQSFPIETRSYPRALCIRRP